MPTSALRRCMRGGPSCASLVGPGRPCPAHPPRAPWAGHGNSGSRGYDAAWRYGTRPRILKRDAYLCGYCGGAATTVDHRTPKAEGGTDEDQNLVACCSRCQGSKAGREGARAAARVRA